MPFGIVAYALMLFSWTTFLETAENLAMHALLLFKTLIDLCITNSPEKVSNSGVIPLRISDHPGSYLEGEERLVASVHAAPNSKSGCKYSTPIHHIRTFFQSARVLLIHNNYFKNCHFVPERSRQTMAYAWVKTHTCTAIWAEVLYAGFKRSSKWSEMGKKINNFSITGWNTKTFWQAIDCKTVDGFD